MWNIQPMDEPLGLRGIQNIQFQILPAESVDNVAETLPVDHVYDEIGRKIGNRWFRVVSSDVGQRMWESLSR